MERLTERFSNGQAAVAGCGNSCKYDYKYCEDDFAENCPTLAEIYEKLAKYEDLEEQGLLLRLPVPIGTKVYGFIKCLAPICDLCKAFKWHEECRPECHGKITEHEMRYRDIPRFGKTVFLTKEQAEEKLKELKDNA